MLSLLLLFLLALLLLALLIQSGGAIESFRSISRRGPVLAVGGAFLVLIAALVYRGTSYMTTEREDWIVRGRTPDDSVSAGFDTKARFRGLAQPLGRVFDRNGTLLAGYTMRDGHLARTYPAAEATAHIVGYWTGPVRDGVGVEKGLVLLNDSLSDDRPHDVRLTLDLRLQRDAMAALAGRIGAVVVVDPTNGAVLAAANYPSFDPNRVWDDTFWRRYATDLDLRPLTSRAIKDNFSPGSSIKPFVALAAHDLGAPFPEDRGFVCDGEYRPAPGIKPIADHGSGHGRIGVERAMRYSCNVYFSYLAYDLLGYDPLTAYLDSLGYDRRLYWNTGLFLNRYATLLPATSWTRARDEIARSRIGIGQASVKANPLHVGVLMAGLAAGGTFLRPTLELDRPPDTLAWRIDSSSARWIEALLREPLLPGGTAARAFAGMESKGFTVYGKTGTADREPDGREPSWFVSYAEKNGRRFAVVVAIQNRRGEYAGDLNAPIARRMYESLDRLGYFRTAARKLVRRDASGSPEPIRRK